MATLSFNTNNNFTSLDSDGVVYNDSCCLGHLVTGGNDYHFLFLLPSGEDDGNYADIQIGTVFAVPAYEESSTRNLDFPFFWVGGGFPFLYRMYVNGALDHGYTGAAAMQYIGKNGNPQEACQFSRMLSSGAANRFDLYIDAVYGAGVAPITFQFRTGNVQEAGTLLVEQTNLEITSTGWKTFYLTPLQGDFQIHDNGVDYIDAGDGYSFLFSSLLADVTGTTGLQLAYDLTDIDPTTYVPSYSTWINIVDMSGEPEPSERYLFLKARILGDGDVANLNSLSIDTRSLSSGNVGMNTSLYSPQINNSEIGILTASSDIRLYGNNFN